MSHLTLVTAADAVDDDEPDAVAEALAKLPPRDAALTLIAGYRAARAAFDREAVESRERVDRLLAAVEQWAETGVLPPLAKRLVELFNETDWRECSCGRCRHCQHVAELAAKFWGAFSLDDFAFNLICELHPDDRDDDFAENVLGHLRGCISESMQGGTYSDRVEAALEQALRAALMKAQA